MKSYFMHIKLLYACKSYFMHGKATLCEFFFVCLWEWVQQLVSDREFLHMTPLFRSIKRSQTVHYWPWSRTSTSCLAVHCRSCTSSSAVQLKYTSPCISIHLGLEITLHALMPTPVQLSTVGQPLIQGNHKLHVIEVPVQAAWPATVEPFTIGRTAV